MTSAGAGPINHPNLSLCRFLTLFRATWSELPGAYQVLRAGSSLPHSVSIHAGLLSSEPPPPPPPPPHRWISHPNVTQTCSSTCQCVRVKPGNGGRKLSALT